MSNELRSMFQNNYNYHEISILNPSDFKHNFLKYNTNIAQESFLNLPTGFDVSNFEEFIYPIYPDFNIMVASKKMYSRTKHIIVAFYEKPGLVFIPLPNLGNDDVKSIGQELGFVLNHRYFAELPEYGFINLLQIANEKFHNVFSGLIEPNYQNNILCKDLIEVIVTETFNEDEHILNLKLFSKECIIKQDNFKFSLDESQMRKIVQQFLIPFNLTKEEVQKYNIHPELTTEYVHSFSEKMKSNTDLFDELKKLVS